MVFFLDDPDQMKWLLESGIDGIITNRPGLLFGQVVRHRWNIEEISITIYNTLYKSEENEFCVPYLI